MHCMATLTLLFFFVFSAFVFLCTQNADFGVNKIEIELYNENDLPYSEFIDRIQKACNDSNTDIMFSYMKYDQDLGKESEYVIFKTSNNDGFIRAESKNGTLKMSDNEAYSTDPKLISDGFKKNKLIFVDVFYDYTIYPLSAMTINDMEKSICETDSSDVVKLSGALSNYNISVKKHSLGYVGDNTLYNVLYIGMAVMLILTFFSILFWQLSESRTIAIKRLEGYSFKQTAVDMLNSFMRFYIIELLFFFISSMAFFIIVSGFDLFIFYLKNNIYIILLATISIPMLYIVSCVYIFFVNPLITLKGMENKKFFYALAVIAKYMIITVLLIVCNTSLVSLKNYYNEMKAYQNISDKLQGYHVITKTREKENEEDNYKKFYDMTHYSNNAIMMHAMPCTSSEFEGNIKQWYVIINDNYMKFNPIYSPDGKQITFEDVKNDKAVMLIPESVSENEAVAVHKRRFKNVPYEEIKVYKYINDQKFYIFQDADTKYPGYIMHPIVILHQPDMEVSGIIANGELVFKSHTNNFSKEITPLLKECNIEWETGSTPSIESVFESIIHDLKIEVIVYIIVICVFIFLFISAILYEAWLYYKNNQKRFTILKMGGYNFFMIHKCQIIFKIIIYALIIAICLSNNINIIPSMILVSFDYIFFYAILESKTATYSSTVLKGA